MANIQKQMEAFQALIKAKYPDLRIGYTYDADEDYYHIWHTNRQLQYEDDIFPVFIGGLLKDCFYSQDIFNFSFGYNYSEDEKSRLVYEFKSHYYNQITINIAKQLITRDIDFYTKTEHYSAFNWPKLEAISIGIDNVDLSFCNQHIRQAKLSIEVSEDMTEQTEKALAA